MLLDSAGRWANASLGICFITCYNKLSVLRGVAMQKIRKRLHYIWIILLSAILVSIVAGWFTSYSNFSFTSMQVSEVNHEFTSDKTNRIFLDYHNIIIAVYVSLLLGYSAASITLYALLRSAIERTQDENPMMETILGRYSQQNSRRLFYNIAICFDGLLYGMMLHHIVTFTVPSRCWERVTLGILLVFFVIISFNTGRFWYHCVSTSKQYARIASNLWEKYSQELERILDKTYALHTAALPDNAENFVLLLSKIDQLLQMNNPQIMRTKPLSTTEINNILSERWSVFDPMYQNIKNVPWLHSKLKMLQRNNQILENWEDYNAWEKAVIQLLKIYQATDGLRCILLSRKYLQAHSHCNYEFRRFPHGNAAELLWKEVLRLFTSCVRIADFIYNGATFNNANFFNSHLEHDTLYGAEFYNCIFSYARLSSSSLDMSSFSTVGFEHTQFRQTSLSNSKFEDCCFDGAIGQHVNMSRCLFCKGSIKGSDWDDCIWNDCVFEEINLDNIRFSDSDLGEWQLKQLCSIENCSFEHSRIEGWKFSDETSQEKFAFNSCSFVGSTLTGFSIEYADMTSSNFEEAILPHAQFCDIILEQSLFSKANLPFSQFNKVSMVGADLSKSNIFQSEWRDVSLDNSNMLLIKAQAMKMTNCCLKQCNCADSDWSKLTADHADMTAARLTGCRLAGAKLEDSKFCGALASDLQFTDAECTNVDFSHSTMTNSNFSNTKFEKCKFQYADLTDIGAANSCFEACILEYTDFSNTRFIKTKWFGVSQSQPMIIKGVKFVNCMFIECKMKDVQFQDCDFKGAFFENCCFNRVDLGARLEDQFLVNCRWCEGDN